MQDRACTDCGGRICLANRSGRCRACIDQARRIPRRCCQFCERLVHKRSRTGLCKMHFHVIRYATKPACSQCGKLLSRRNKTGLCQRHRAEHTRAWQSRVLELHAAGVELKEIAGRVGRREPYVWSVITRAQPPAELARDPEFPLRAIRVAAAELGAEPADLRGDASTREFVRARWAVMLAMHRRGATNPRIARRLGRDTSTVWRSLDRAKYIVDRDPAFAALVRRVDQA